MTDSRGADDIARGADDVAAGSAMGISTRSPGRALRGGHGPALTGTRGSLPTWCFVAAVAAGVVLRLWDVGAASLSADESYSAVAATLPLADLLPFLRDTDPHPPLSYLLAKPFVAISDEAWALRLLPALCSAAAVAVMAVWQHRRGIAGFAAVVVMALGPEQLAFARQARMYGLVVLAGTVAAWAAERWLERGGRPWMLVAAGAGLVASLSHALGFVVLLGLWVVPSWRGDRAAWELRAAVAGAGLVAAAVFGPTLVSRAGTDTFYPTTDLEWLSITLNELVAPVPDQRWLVLALLAGGSTVVLACAGALRRVWCALFLGPVALLAAVGLWSGVLAPKSLMVVSWGVAVALGSLIGWAWDQRWLAGGLVAVLVVLLTVPYVDAALTLDEGSGSMVDAVRVEARPGDVVAMRPGNLGTLLEWYLGRVDDRELVPLDVELPETVAWVVDAERPTGVVWLVEAPGRVDQLDGTDLVRCGDTVDVGGGYRLTCLDRRAIDP